MKKIISTVILTILLSSTAHAAEWFEPMSKKDWTRQGIFYFFQGGDYWQTVRGSKSDRWVENNPILGDSPSVAQVSAYFVVTTTAHTLISYALPTEIGIFTVKINPRAIWQYTWIGIQANQVRRNYVAGIRVPW